MLVQRINHFPKNLLDQVAALHLATLDDSFFSLFGKEFLKTFYKPIPKSSGAIFLVATDKGKLIGFALGIIDGQKVLRTILLSSFLPLIFKALPTALRRPVVIPQTISMVFQKPSELGKPELQFIAVSPKYQGRGVGKNLVQKLIREFAAEKIDSFLVGTAASNQKSNDFYKHLGFKFAGKSKVFGQTQNFYSSPKN